MMRFVRRARHFCLIGLLLLAIAAVWPGSVLAQCEMCRAGMGAASPRGMRAMNRGIVMLLFPAVAMMFGIGVVVYRRRD